MKQKKNYVLNELLILTQKSKFLYLNLNQSNLIFQKINGHIFMPQMKQDVIFMRLLQKSQRNMNIIILNGTQNTGFEYLKASFEEQIEMKKSSNLIL
ncbi:unnamed protein product [Paramecium sonneborni]|uniref:Uncharacterized protein n=1 Tax=Paramecium sonneborni TaxID=65129 RepID=A0A8S1MJ74_9CILI|nr:unnamed protein product [Paramecium sonneborni]